MDSKDGSSGGTPVADDLEQAQLRELAEEWERVMRGECTAVRKMDPRIVYKMLAEIL